MYVYMCVCACMYVCMVHIKCIGIYMCMYMCVCACMYVCMVHIKSIGIYMCVCIYVCMCVYVCVYGAYKVYWVMYVVCCNVCKQFTDMYKYVPEDSTY